MLRRISLIAVLVQFLAVSCDRTTTAPEPTAEPVAEVPTYNFMNGPEHSGMVWRWNNYHISFYHFDETPGDPWAVVVGLPDGDVLMSCGGAGTSEPKDVHEVWFDDEFRSILNQSTREAAVQAYDAAEFWGTWDSDGHCAALELEPLAYGVANQNLNDNDALAVRDHNVWQEKANGYVDYMGERYRLHYSAHWSWNASLDEPFSETIKAWIK